MSGVAGRASSSWPRLLALAAAGLLVAWLLQVLATHQLHEALRSDAARAIAAEASGRTPYSWPLQSRAELVAGRVFGATGLQLSSEGMKIRAAAESVEIGLKIAHPVDLDHYRILRLKSSAPLRVMVRERLDGPLCTSEPLVPQDGAIGAGLMDLTWHCDGHPAPAPKRAAMLRVAPQLRADEQAVLRDVQLDCAPKPGNARCAQLPHVTLALRGRVEEVLQRRDMLRDLAHASIIMPGPDAGTVTSPPETSGKGVLLLLALLQAAGLVMLWLARPSRSRRRACMEVALACAGPLVVIIGGYYGAHVAPDVIVVAALSVLILARLAWQSRHTLRLAWRMPSAASWLLPAVTVAAALALVFALGPTADFTWQPRPADVAQYLVWAAIQQLWIGVLVAQRAGVALRSAPAGALLAAIIFALLHTPNAMLMQLSLVGGALWFINWQRYGTLLPGIVAHAACGLLLRQGMGPDWLRSAEVSARFFL